MGEKFFGMIFAGLMEFLDKFFSPFLASFKYLSGTILTIYILYVGLAMIFGKDKPGKEMLVSAVIAFIVTPIFSSYGLYKVWIIDPTLSTSLGISNYFLTGYGDTYSITHIFKSVDQTFSNLFIKLDQITNAISWYEISKVVAVLLLALLGALLYALFLMLMLGALFAMTVFFVIGGIPLFFLIVPKTRFIFWSWFRALSNYALIPVFTSVVMAISLYFLDSLIGDFTALDIEDFGLFTAPFAAVALMFVIAIFFHLKAPEFAAALTGSQPSGIGGIGTTAAGLTAASIWGAKSIASPMVTKYGPKAYEFAHNAYSKMRGL